MAPSMKKGLWRIGSNYARLLLNLALGLALVPLLIGWLGLEGFGVVALLGASVGVAQVFKDLTQRSMVRELGAAYHSGDRELFLRAYNSAYLLTGGLALLTAVCFVAIYLFLPVLNIPPELRGPAAGFLLWQASFMTLIVLFSPTFNMYMVEHRFAAYNLCLVLLRSANFVAAVLLAVVFGVSGDPAPLTLYSLVWASIASAVLLTAVGLAMLRDDRLRLRPRYIGREALRSIFGTFGWNTGVQFSMAAIEKTPPFILNLMIGGVVVNAIWGVVFQLSSYVRMVTVGVQFGADSVSAKMASGDDQEKATARVRAFMASQTRLNSLVALPAGLTLFVLAGPILDAWLASKLEDPESVIGPATLMTRILAVAIVTRAVSEGWVLILYGAGYVSRYAPVIFAGGVLAPVLGVLFTMVLPEGLRIQGPALGFTVVFSGVYLFALPIVGARCVGLTYMRVLAPMARPLGAAALPAPLLFLGYWLPGLVGTGFVGQVVVPAVSFGAVYAACSWWLVLGASERRRLLSVLERRGGRAPAEPGVTR